MRFRFILNGTPEANEAKRFATEQMREQLGDRSDIAEKIIPTEFGIGCRRPTVSKYDTYSRGEMSLLIPKLTVITKY